MPLTAQSTIFNYTGNASTTVFAYTCKILVAGDMKVYLDGVLQSAGYAVSGVGVDAGGSVTFTVAPGTGVLVRLQRIVALDRTTDYTEGGALAADTLDDDFDRIVMQVQNLDALVIKEASDGAIDAGSRRIKNVANPTAAQDAATKNWAETSMTSQIGQAITQASNSAASAAAALASQNSASASASTATTQAGIATTQAGNAAASASTATTQAGIATTQAGNAAASASTATTQAGNAAASASTATTQAGIATTQAGLAATSFDDFDDRYLGSKSSNPALDNDGNALLTGALYWNSVSTEMRAWSGSAWLVTYIPSSGVPAINPGTPKDGDIQISAGPVINIYATTAWRQIFPPVYQ